ncbi:N-6 DNA methylase [Streptomyces sp. Ru87]|uniref:N-6 DNA methylase n=1 Tax=Streptomyces sp. Ru87 TaxID=2044307 RepID=UPI0015D4A598|nr:N-6 DNA methylase [Streptomyces sp. Ru87]
MATGGIHEDGLIMRSRIGVLAGVARPTVTSWARCPGFPSPVRAGEVELFHQAEVLAWLDNRIIPRRSLQTSERDGATYGDRARRVISRQQASADPIPTVPSPPTRSDSADRQRVRELMGDMADRIRGAASAVDYMNLLLCLHFLRVAGGPQWDAVTRVVDAGHGLHGTGVLLDAIGRATDERLRRLGTVSGMRDALLRLEPRTYGDLRSVVRQVGQLGRGAFRYILDEYETRARLRSAEFFTPRAVARIMAEAASDGSGRPPETIHDPYARGGELLAGAVAACAARGGTPAGLYVHGFSHGRDTVQLASMNLALHGVRPRVRLTSGAPWAPKADAGAVAHCDLVLTNPPFNMSDSAGEARTHGTWPYGPPPVGNDNFAYLQHAVGLLGEGGSAAVVMPNKAGNSANRAEVEIRRNLLERGVVKCVIALPDRLFSSTPVPVSVWILVHPAQPCDEVLFLDARKLGARRRGKRVLGEEDVQAVLTAYRFAVPCVGAHTGREWDGGVVSALLPRNDLRTMDCSLSPTDRVEAARTPQEDADSALARTVHEADVRLRETHTTDAADTLRNLDFQPPHPTRPVALSELCDIKAGPSYSALRAEQRTPYGDVPLVFPKDLSEGRIAGPGERRVTAELASRLRSFRLEPGDIVCVRSGAVGPPALVREREAGWLMSTNVLRLRLRDGAPADPEYLLACLSRPEAVGWVRDRAASTGAPSISAKALGYQQVALPPYDEQRRLARMLAALEEQALAHSRAAAAMLDLRAALTERMVSGC